MKSLQLPVSIYARLDAFPEGFASFFPRFHRTKLNPAVMPPRPELLPCIRIYKDEV
jgi:hypothetical protein